MSVDFTGLRGGEEYDNPRSRIPTVTVGTPYEDAMRRDFTVNALFYNLQTRLVEDYTGRGVDDLRSQRRARAPLLPPAYFIDSLAAFLLLYRRPAHAPC